VHSDPPAKTISEVQRKPQVLPQNHRYSGHFSRTFSIQFYAFSGFALSLRLSEKILRFPSFGEKTAIWRENLHFEEFKQATILSFYVNGKPTKPSVAAESYNNYPHMTTCKSTNLPKNLVERLELWSNSCILFLL
jgi:hypothetical protein